MVNEISFLSSFDCPFDFADLRDANISFSSDDTCTAPNASSSISLNEITAANLPKLIEKVIISGDERDMIRLCICIPRLYPVEMFVEMLEQYWFHALDHGDTRQLSTVLEILSVLPKVLDSKHLRRAYRLLESWIDDTEEDLFENEKFAFRETLIQAIRWLRYEWDEGKLYAFSQESPKCKKFRLSKKPKKIERTSVSLLKRNHRIISGIETFQMSEYIILERPDIIAAHLCLIQENHLRSLKWQDVLDVSRGSSKAHTEKLRKFIKRSNKMTEWAIFAILFPPHDTQKYVPRHLMIERIFAVTAHLFRLRNYDCMISLLLALQHPSITRLHETWKLVSPRVKRQCGLLATKGDRPILSSFCTPTKNWKALRELTQDKIMNPSLRFAFGEDSTCPPPAICYFGLIVNDLIMNKEAKHDYVPSSSSMYQEPLLNVKKMFFQADTVTDAFCIGCQGVDVLGRRLRSTYWDTLFLEDRMPLKPHIYQCLNDLETSLDNIFSTYHLHPSIVHLSVAPGERDYYKLSKIIE